MNSITTGKPEVRSIMCCVLFDSSDGTIRHTHQIVNMEGVEEPSEDQVEKRARQLAKELAVDITNLHALHVDVSSIKPGMKYAVDPNKRCLVALERTGHGSCSLHKSERA